MNLNREIHLGKPFLLVVLFLVFWITFNFSTGLILSMISIVVWILLKKRSTKNKQEEKQTYFGNKQIHLGKKTKIVSLTIVGLLVLYGISSGFFHGVYIGFSGGHNQPSFCSDTASLKNQATTVDFKELDKNPDSFKGKIVKFTGEVLQIQESYGYGTIRLAVTKDSYGWSINDIIYVEYQNHIDVIEDNVITVYGQLTGSKTYESQANWNITIPSMTACVIEKSTETTQNQPTSKQPQAQDQTTQQPVTPITPPTPKSWHTVYTITTDTTKNTPPFTIQGSQWRAYWSCQAESPVNTTPSVSAKPTTGYGSDNIADPNSCPSDDTTYLYNGPGEFYLDINIYSSATMTITVEDYY